ncbi:transcriptional repressor [Micromonospora sp. NBRC 101691]|uniref:transcriptional repressor n=1 Tax=Micromonospora TaxID=1873 RepID=UPI0024A322FC|nr:transcriptional repressor [Micromonospora sp. NBRC 101691]GLY24644.1 hypothetical protein Misp04_43760 [Micromonospora sp. NBRC 101691]
MITSKADRVAAAVTQLRRAGLRNTAARRAVLDQLADAVGDRGHLTASEVHCSLLTRGLMIELSTAHRVLRQLVNLEIAYTVPVGRTITFGLADDAHHHAACGRSGELRQLTADRLES